MFHPKIVEFFKKHNLYDREMFGYLYSECQFVDYYDHDVNFMVGCPPKTNKYTNKIEGFSLVLPYAWDERTILVSIHELAHAIYWYKKMGQKYNKAKDEIEVELFPMLVERTYVEENLTKGLASYEAFLDGTIDSNDAPQYRFAIESRDQFSSSDIEDFVKLDKATKKLARRWRRQNR